MIFLTKNQKFSIKTGQRNLDVGRKGDFSIVYLYFSGGFFKSKIR